MRRRDGQSAVLRRRLGIGRGAGSGEIGGGAFLGGRALERAVCEDQAVPADLDVHLIVDNYATHKHPKVRAWLARHTRYHMHFTPTYSSWLNQVERWFGLITQRAIRRGSFKSVRQLITSIERYIEQYNQHGRPFVWTSTADSILQKVARLCKVISGT